eukprot:11972665-Alexandrium_andersonii.AAC.1
MLGLEGRAFSSASRGSALAARAPSDRPRDGQGATASPGAQADAKSGEKGAFGRFPRLRVGAFLARPGVPAPRARTQTRGVETRTSESACKRQSGSESAFQALEGGPGRWALGAEPRSKEALQNVAGGLQVVARARRVTGRESQRACTINGSLLYADPL